MLLNNFPAHLIDNLGILVKDNGEIEAVKATVPCYLLPNYLIYVPGFDLKASVPKDKLNYNLNPDMWFREDEPCFLTNIWVKIDEFFVQHKKPRSLVLALKPLGWNVTPSKYSIRNVIEMKYNIDLLPDFPFYTSLEFICEVGEKSTFYDSKVEMDDVEVFMKYGC